jgi:hypothetical protein
MAMKTSSKKQSSPKKKSSATKRMTVAELKAKTMSHETLLAPMAATAAGEVLGHARAIVIVCACAGTNPTNLPRTLGQLGVNGVAFQRCVFNGVQTAGFNIALANIPNSPSTTLIQVVAVIENAPTKGI